MSDDERRDEGGPDSFRDGVRSITGVLGALKEALESTFEDLRKQGEFTPERAREAAAATIRRAQEVVDEMRGRLEFVPRAEFEELRREVHALRARFDAREGTGTTEPDVSAPASSSAGATAATPAAESVRDEGAGSGGSSAKKEHDQFRVDVE